VGACSFSVRVFSTAILTTPARSAEESARPSAFSYSAIFGSASLLAAGHLVLVIPPARGADLRRAQHRPTLEAEMGTY
jgi:hypothetical protein